MTIISVILLYTSILQDVRPHSRFVCILVIHLIPSKLISQFQGYFLEKAQSNPRVFRTVLSAISSNFLRSSLHVLAASTFAALSSLGSGIEIE